MERLDHNIFRSLILRDDPTILDIGANDGASSLVFKHFFPKARIHCFEPDPRAIENFKRIHSDSSDIWLYDFALGPFNGKCDFYQSDGVPTDDDPIVRNMRPEGWDLSGSIKKPLKHIEEVPWCRFDNKISIDCIKLDTWLACRPEIEEIDLIWMDVQGAEEDVLANGGKALNITKYLFTEYSNLELYQGQKNLKYLIQMLENFSIIKIYESDVLLKNCNI
jgi:FkbM family methyltransferase